MKGSLLMTILKKLSFAIVAFFVISLSIGVSFGNQEGKDFLIHDFKSGETKSFQDILATKANMVIVTETTCYSCIKELQAMELLRAKYKDNLLIAAVFVDRQGLNKVEKYLEYYNFDLDMLLVDEGSAIPRNFKVTYIPTLLMFDQEGNEVFRKEGFNPGDESLFSKKIEEIVYAESPRKRDKAKTKSDEAPGSVKKTSGCASTPS
jgi:thiol-disulfide isomerase/thioredoxin